MNSQKDANYEIKSVMKLITTSMKTINEYINSNSVSIVPAKSNALADLIIEMLAKCDNREKKHLAQCCPSLRIRYAAKKSSLLKMVKDFKNKFTNTNSILCKLEILL